MVHYVYRESRLDSKEMDSSTKLLRFFKSIKKLPFIGSASNLVRIFLNLIQTRCFWSSCGQGEGTLCPHVPLVLTACCYVFLKACPKLDHMTHFHFHGNRFKCFKVAQRYFSAKTSNQRHCTNGKSFGI